MRSRSGKPGSLSSSDVSPQVCVLDVFQTDLGWMGIQVAVGGVQRVVFDCQSATQAEVMLGAAEFAADARLERSVPAGVDKLVAELRDGLVDFAQGKRVDFGFVPLATRHMTTFQAAVIEHCRAIPYGQTSSYGQLAEAAGYPRAARAVGSVMSRNRWPLIVPCHRVISSGGGLRGFSSRRGLSMKQILLELEQRSTASTKRRLDSP